MLNYCEREKIGFIPWNPINAGHFAALGAELESISKRHRVTAPQLALAWLLWRSPVMLPIPGTSKVVHLEENAAAAALKVDEKELQGLNRAA